MNGVPQAISGRMRAVLEGVAEAVCPGNAGLVVEHAWFDENYVGRTEDKVAAWRGWSVNLRRCGDYRTLYINYVINHFSQTDNEKLFGAHFARVVNVHDEYICLYVTACNIKIKDVIEATKYTYKSFNRALHPSLVLSLSDFSDTTLSILISDGLALLSFQRDYC